MRKIQIRTDWHFTVHDKSGLLLYDRTEEGNSILGNFVGVFWTALLNNHPAQVVHGPVIDTGGIPRSLASNSNQAQDYITGGAGQVDRSIVLGTGAAANTIDTSQLQTLIAQGVGAGQLNYGATILIDPVAGTNPRSFQFSKLIGGNAVSAVVVNEAGLIIFLNTQGFHILVERSVVTPFNIPANGACVAVCTISVSI